MEGKTMKKRSIVTITAIIMSLLLMGCTEGEAAPVAQTINRPTEAPTEEVKPTEAPTPTEAVVETAEHTEAPVDPTPSEEPKKNPNVIDGVNFSIYNLEVNPLTFVTEEHIDDCLRVISIQGGYGYSAYIGGSNRVEGLLKDGDSFIQTIDESLNNPGVYAFALYTPKLYKDWQLNNTENIEYTDIYDLDSMPYIKQSYLLGQVFKIKDDVTVEGAELSITVTYEDDTQETITVYITKDYTL